MVGIDTDAANIELVRRQDPTGQIDYHLGDFLVHPFRPQSFDAIT